MSSSIDSHLAKPPTDNGTPRPPAPTGPARPIPTTPPPGPTNSIALSPGWRPGAMEINAELARGLVEANAAALAAGLDAKNQHTGAAYSSVDAIVAASTPAFAAGRLAPLRVATTEVDGRLRVLHAVFHESGHGLVFHDEVPLAKKPRSNPIQDRAEAISYAWKGFILTVLNIARLESEQTDQPSPQKPDRPAADGKPTNEQIAGLLDGLLARLGPEKYTAAIGGEPGADLESLRPATRAAAVAQLVELQAAEAYHQILALDPDWRRSDDPRVAARGKSQEAAIAISLGRLTRSKADAVKRAAEAARRDSAAPPAKNTSKPPERNP